MSDDMFYARVCQERDQLRAELAAAKDLLARIHRDGGHHTEAVGVSQSVSDADNKVSEWLLAAEERDRLAADNERLRKALERSIAALVFADTPESKAFHFGDLVAQLRETIAATPAQSLAAHDAALMREVTRLVDDCSGEKLRAEADRIEKEAAK